MLVQRARNGDTEFAHACTNEKCFKMYFCVGYSSPFIFKAGKGVLYFKGASAISVAVSGDSTEGNESH